MKNKILVTGGDGIFSTVLKKENKSLNLIFKSKKECDILFMLDRDLYNSSSYCTSL